MSNPYSAATQERLPSDCASTYTLASMNSPSTPLLLDNNRSTTTSYGTVPEGRVSRFGLITRHKPLLYAALKCALIFVVSSAVLGFTLWLALPTVDEEDRDKLHIPKSFVQLKELNTLLKKYRDIYPFRVVICYVVVYLFLQAFSLPGSMYLSILAGAVWGQLRAIVLACTCVATGATLCYLLSAAFGPALLTLPRWRSRLDRWSEKIEDQRSNLISFLIILRIAPFPPHWVVNVLCPHLRISIVPFWISTFFGIMGVTIIHTAIGNGLDQMTSADDFHLISFKNFALLASIVFAVSTPVGLRHALKVKPPNIPPSPALSSISIEPDTISIESDEFGPIPAPKYSDNPEDGLNKPPTNTIAPPDDPEVDDEILASGGPEQSK